MSNILKDEQASKADTIDNHVTAEFSRQALVYDQAAHVQKIAAQRLDKTISIATNSQITGNILDIGCGTGILSKYLWERFPKCQIYLIDPASGMIDTCKQNFSNHQKFNSVNSIKRTVFIESTIENYLTNASYRNINYKVIASSFTFHWLANLPAVLNALINRLEVGGQLFFSYPISGSFPEWQELCDRLNLPFTANSFPTSDELTRTIKSEQAKIDWNEYYCQRNFSSALEFFREIKMMGATSPSPSQVPNKANRSDNNIKASNLRRLIKAWDEQIQFKNSKAAYETEDKYNQTLSCTYRIIEGIITRRT